jgi:dihydrofolate reductase
MEVVAIAAIGRNRELGKGNELLWHIPDDLKRFKELSMGHPIILGRKTFESIVAMIGKPLPGRTNIVVSRSSTPLGVNDPNVILANSIEDALKKAKQALGGEKVIIGGGAQIYKEALPYTDILHLTLIDDSMDADSFFPEYENEFTNQISEEHGRWNELNYRWVDVGRN